MRKIALDVASSFSGARRYRPPEHMAEWAYPVDLRFTLRDIKKYYSPMGDDGLPFKRYGSVGVRRNPTRVAAFALGHYNRLVLDGDHRSRGPFLRAAAWFAAQPNARWEYDFDWGTLKAPWISAMAQGEAISVLVRAHRLTGDVIYLDAATRAVTPFHMAIGEGGVKSALPDGQPFVEEYPEEPPKHTLNGFLYAIIGLIDLAALDVSHMPLLQSLITSLERNIGRYDLSGWSAYDLHATSSGSRNPATMDYHGLHVTQLDYVAVWAGSSPLARASERWQRSAGLMHRRLIALSQKARYRFYVRPQR